MPFVSPFFSFSYCPRLHLLYWIKKSRGDLILKCKCPLSEITEPTPLMCATSFSSYICSWALAGIYHFLTTYVEKASHMSDGFGRSFILFPS